MPTTCLTARPPPQVMGMPGMVTSIVESLKYITPMAFDVMTFAVLKQLASPKKKLKVGGLPAPGTSVRLPGVAMAAASL